MAVDVRLHFDDTYWFVGSGGSVDYYNNLPLLLRCCCVAAAAAAAVHSQ